MRRGCSQLANARQNACTISRTRWSCTQTWTLSRCNLPQSSCFCRHAPNCSEARALRNFLNLTLRCTRGELLHPAIHDKLASARPSGTKAWSSNPPQFGSSAPRLAYKCSVCTRGPNRTQGFLGMLVRLLRCTLRARPMSTPPPHKRREPDLTGTQLQTKCRTDKHRCVSTLSFE